MPPYEIAIGANTQTTEKNISSNMVGLNKVITKWWTEGKITDEVFIRNVEYLQNSGVIRPH